MVSDSKSFNAADLAGAVRTPVHLMNVVFLKPWLQKPMNPLENQQEQAMAPFVIVAFY